MVRTPAGSLLNQWRPKKHDGSDDHDYDADYDHHWPPARCHLDMGRNRHAPYGLTTGAVSQLLSPASIRQFGTEVGRPLESLASALALAVRPTGPAEALGSKVCACAAPKCALDSGAWTPRELRHSFVSLMSDAGVSVEYIARRSGTAVPPLPRLSTEADPGVHRWR